jgi:hypothetical protein
VQIAYHIATSLANYYHDFQSGKWSIPDFSDECPICSGADCAKYWGTYTRRVVEPMSGFSADDFPIMRFRCFRVGKPHVRDVTFSLLPLELVPYRRLSVKFLLEAVLVRVKRKLSWLKAEAAVEEELVDLVGVDSLVSVVALMSWVLLMEEGLLRLVASGLRLVEGMPDAFAGDEGVDGLVAFLEGAKGYVSTRLEPRIRGPDALAMDFYLMSGGWQNNAAFLFGTPSQHRGG